MTETDKDAWDAGEHEGCGKDTERAVLKFSTTLEEVEFYDVNAKGRTITEQGDMFAHASAEGEKR